MDNDMSNPSLPIDFRINIHKILNFEAIILDQQHKVDTSVT